MLPRHAISDVDWDRIKSLLPTRGPAGDRRLFVDAVPYVARTGIPWRGLPDRFGHWNAVWRRFDRGSRTGVWVRVRGPSGPGRRVARPRLDRGPRPPERRRGAKKAGGPAGQCLGRGRGGFGTKAHAAMSGLGLPVRLPLSPGQFGDPGQAGALLGGLGPGTVIVDKGYDSAAVVDRVRAAGARVVIPAQKSRKVQRDTDWHRYKDRNLVERFWAGVKQCRRVATRYEKTARNYLGFRHVASVMLLLQ